MSQFPQRLFQGDGESGDECLKDLLYSLMLESHNDAAVAIAEGIDGSVEAICNATIDDVIDLDKKGD